MLSAGLTLQTWHQPFAAGTGIVIGVVCCHAEETCKNYGAVAAAGTVPGLSQMETVAVEKIHEPCCTTLHLAVVLVMWMTS